MANPPDGFELPTVAQIEKIGTNAWKTRQLTADPTRYVDVGPRTLPAIIAAAFAQMLVPVLSNTVRAAEGFLIRGLFGDRLLAKGDEMGAGGKLEATGASGYVVASSIATTGAEIQAGDILTHAATSLSFEVIITKVYVDGEAIPVQAVDTGPETNLLAGTVLEFSSPRSGCSITAVVEAQNDGSGDVTHGLTGGREAETDEEYQERLIDLQANPPASGNNGEIVFEAQRCPGIPVQKAWVIPCWGGPGTACVLFTVRPDQRTGTRIPNGVQRGRMQAHLQALFPADFGISVGSLLGDSVEMALGVTWRAGVASWTDANPWPPYFGALSPYVLASPAPTATTVRLTTFPVQLPLGDGDTPIVGQTIGFYDIANKRFVKKKIATVTEISSRMTWDLTFETTNAASDTSFIPANPQRASPWSESLNTIPAAVIGILSKMGPGEQFSSFYDPGTRQRRVPQSPAEWSSVLSNVDVSSAVKATNVVSDVELKLPNTPYDTPVGTPGVLSYLIELGDLAVYEQT